MLRILFSEVVGRDVFMVRYAYISTGRLLLETSEDPVLLLKISVMN